MTVQDAKPDVSRKRWESDLSAIGEREGFFRQLGKNHSALYSERGSTLIVTFENLDHVIEHSEDRLPWGYSLTEAKNWSLLGLMAHEWSWYRDKDVMDFFDELKESGFFEKFDRVIFYGASMGAYAACAFSSASPGADVVAISPQATLDRDVASWETRYRKAWRRNYNDRYGYAPDQVKLARRVILIFDPCAPLDAMHAALFRGDNITRFKCRFMGHRIMSLWGAMGVLKPVAQCLLSEELDEVEFWRLMRARHDTRRYQFELLGRATDAKRDEWIVRICKGVLSRRGAPRFRKAMKEANERILQKRKIKARQAKRRSA